MRGEGELTAWVSLECTPSPAPAPACHTEQVAALAARIALLEERAVRNETPNPNPTPNPSPNPIPSLSPSPNPGPDPQQAHSGIAAGSTRLRDFAPQLHAHAAAMQAHP